MRIFEIKYKHAISSRLDRLLLKDFPMLTHGVLNRYIRKKDVKVNGRKIACDTRIDEGDIITVPYFFLEKYTAIAKLVSTKNDISLSQKLLGKYLIYDDVNFIAIDKPQGLSVQGGTKIKYSINSAINHLNSNNNSYKLVHRIDKDTSGLLLIAKHLDAARILTDAFKKREIKKTYHAILQGILKYDAGWIIDGKYFTSITTEQRNNSFSITRFEVVNKNYNKTNIIFFPLTGRKHQLRQDAASLGCPIIGDIKYNKNYLIHSRKLMLHAAEIKIPEQLFGQEYHIKSQPSW